jgi:hypothetical protein
MVGYHLTINWRGHCDFAPSVTDVRDRYGIVGLAESSKRALRGFVDEHQRMIDAGVIPQRC